MNDKLNRVIKYGKEIVEKTKDEEEKEMIPKTIESLVGKMSQVKLWLDEKRNQVSYKQTTYMHLRPINCYG